MWHAQMTRHVQLPRLCAPELLQYVLLVYQVGFEEGDTTCVTGFPVTLREMFPR